MGKIAKLISTVLSFILIMGVFLYAFNYGYDKRIGGRYYDEIGGLYGDTVKNQGLVLQEKSIMKDDNLPIFGSSELGSIQKPFYPVDFFANKKDGFQVNLIGRGYSQSLIHAINLGALGDSLKNKKIVIIISPQWFSSTGLRSQEFKMNFSELQFYAFMSDNNVDKSVKDAVADRVRQLLGKNSDFDQVKMYSDLYASGNMASKAMLGLLMPYYNFKYYLLSIKDKVRTDSMFKSYSGKEQDLTALSTGFDWESEREKAVEKGRQEANNNEYFIENSYYDAYIKKDLKAYKGSYKNTSYLKSPEYEDFKLLLNICKDLGAKPLIVSVPVHGKWYDYCEFSKEDRQEYYQRIRDIVASYGFDLADFSGHEYDDYFLKDVMHLGWKGWVYVDEAIDKFYHKD